MRTNVICLLVSVGCFIADAFNLECEIKVGKLPLLEANLNVCYAKNLAITERNQTVSSVNGQTVIQFQGNAIRGLRIWSQTVNFFPHGLEKFFPHLQAIDMSNSKMKSIEKSDLKPFTELKEINFGSNEIETLDSDLFEFNPKLRMILFYRNKLTAVGENIFKNLTNLDKAWFHFNTCINKDAFGQIEMKALISELAAKCPYNDAVKEKQRKDLAQQVELKDKEIAELKIKMNQLEAKNKEALKEAIFEKTTQLHVCESKFKSCDGNFNSVVESFFMIQNQDASESFKDHPIDLTCKTDVESVCDAVDLRVEFSNSKVSKVRNQNGTVILTDKIKKLEINLQQTLFMPTNLGEHFSQLTDLTVTSSGLNEFNPAIFKQMKNLRVLNMRDNKIISIRGKAFEGLDNLQELDLSSNRIRVINKDAFKGLGRLLKLKIDYNFLQKLDSFVFQGLTNLKELSLFDNKLKFINSKIPSLFPHLSSLDLRENDCINVTFPELNKQQIEQRLTDQCLAPVELQCSFEEDEDQLQDSTSDIGYVCKTQNLVVENENTKILAVTGNHYDDHDNKNITALVVIEQTFHFIPEQLAKHLPNLNKITVEKSNLRTLQVKSFEGYLNIKTITMRYNNMSLIEEGTFDANKILEYLNLAYNNLNSLPIKIFAKLTNLKILILSHNQLQTLSVDVLSKENLILELKLDNNKLSKVDRRIIGTLRNANKIDFTMNSCVDVKYETNQNGKSVCGFAELYMEIDMKCS